MNATDTIDVMFRNELQKWSVEHGTVHSPTGVRQVWLSADILSGIHEALSYEAGEAWPIILKTCGRRWGQTVVRHLAHELKQADGGRPEDLTVDAYLEWLKGWFAHVGWGELTVDLAEVQSHGLLQVQVANSPMAETLEGVEGRVDALLEGLLGQVFSAISGTTLDCVELSCVAQGNPVCTFLISGADRIEQASDALEDGEEVAAVLAGLRT